MKKTLLMIFLILSLLVSCATKSVKSDEPQIPSDDAVPETVVEASEAPVEEEPISIVEETAEEIPEEVVEEAVSAEPEETVEEVSQTQEVSEPEFDWSAFMASDPSIWTAPISAKSDEVAAVEETPVEEVSEVVEALETPVEEVVAVTEPVVEAAKEEKPVETVKTPVATAAKVEDESLGAKAKQIVEKVGKFIQREKLFSFGVLTIIIGFIYLIIALVKTSDARLERKEYKASRKAAKKASERTVDESEESSENHADTDLSDDDDEFLRTLLGGND